MFRTIGLMSLAAALASACLPESTAARELNYGSFVSGKAYQNRIVMPRVFKGIEEATEGEVKWTMLAGGQIAKARATLASIRDGVLDAGFIVPAFNLKELINNNVIFQMGFLTTNALAASGAAVETILFDCPQCLEDYRKQNAVFFNGYATTPMVLMCKDEVASIEDLKGKKIRSLGSQTRWMERLGAVPVHMSGPEGMLAMQRGAIDCSAAAIGWLFQFGYKDVTKSIIDYSMGMSAGNSLMVINRDVWKAMSLEHRKALIAQMPYAQADYTINGYIVGDRKALGRAKKGGGLKVTEGGAEFDKIRAEHLAAEKARVAEDMAKQGAKDPAGILAAYSKNLKKWEERTSDIGNDVDAFAKLLDEHIYSRIDPDKL